MSEQPKSKLMARLRARRQAEGMVRVEAWVRPEDVERVRKYVARLSGNKPPQCFSTEGDDRR